MISEQYSLDLHSMMTAL